MFRQLIAAPPPKWRKASLEWRHTVPGVAVAMPKLQRLREIRESKYLSQRMLAEISGVSRPTIARLETSDEEARFATMWKLAKALDVEPGDLVGGTDASE